MYNINDKIHEHSQQWRQYIERMSPYKLVKQIVMYRPQGKGVIGSLGGGGVNEDGTGRWKP